MKQSESQNIVISIDTVDQLFNAGSISPASDKPIVILGEAGLPYAIRQELSHGLRRWQGKRLIIQLPADQVNPGSQLQIVDMIRKYARVKIDENSAMIRLSRTRSLTSLVLAIFIAALLIAFIGIVTNTLLASASDTVKGIFAGLVTIFIWSTVWNPWDRLLYEWIEPWRENRILRNLVTMEIVVQAIPDTLNSNNP